MSAHPPYLRKRTHTQVRPYKTDDRIRWRGTARRAPTSPAALRQGPARRHPLQSTLPPQPQQSLTGPQWWPSLAAMPETPPQFAELNKIEEELLGAKLQAVRSAIVHAGEKGRALEHGVRTLLRSILPTEYGLSTGFIVFHTNEGPRLSSQLDIIIYDAIRSGPIISLETCDVFPLEAVYGYIEVKATLQSSSDGAENLAANSIEKCLMKNRELRGMTDRRYWVSLPDSPIKATLVKHEWVSIRSYVFAFEPVGSIAGSLDALAQRMSNFSKELGSPTHLHGVFVANHGFLYTKPVDARTATPDDCFHIGYTNDHPLLAFKTSLLQGLARFPRPQDEWAPAIEQYFQHEPEWKFRKPEI